MSSVLNPGRQVVQLAGSTVRGGSDYPPAAFFNCEIAGNTAETVFEVKNPIIVDYVQITTSDRELRVRWAHYDKAGAAHLIRVADGRVAGATSNSIALEAARTTHPFLQELVWDEGLGIYVFGLRRPMQLPFGLQIRLQNATSLGVTPAVVVIYREMEA